MRRVRARLNGWTYNEGRQEIRTPSGHIITLQEVAQRLQDDVACRYNFTGAWNGWRMRGPRLIDPGGGILKPDTAPMLARWIADATREAEPAERSRPRLVYSRPG